jgi:hypothetical protein
MSAVILPVFSPLSIYVFRLHAGRDPHSFIIRLLIMFITTLVLAAVLLSFALIDLIRYRRRYPWTPPEPLTLTTVGIRRRMDRPARALEI